MVKVAGGDSCLLWAVLEESRSRLRGSQCQQTLVISPVELYDVILGMDWLSHYRVHLDCYRGRVVFERDAAEVGLSGSETDFREYCDICYSGRAVVRAGL
ncbi:unnamed protein product [Microthlaspi erraticum]|uniref:Uncharacterized protein n=1 Tax=Microthlaspi erraticum TaxID=1685480 RepID=A0A6D2KCQ4_9BRAS|nr:unnamed protein product [Microthlaspi erraticum]